MTEKSGASFAGEKANAGVPELRKAAPEAITKGQPEDVEIPRGAPEDPAVIGGSSSVSIPDGTEVKLDDNGRVELLGNIRR